MVFVKYLWSATANICMLDLLLNSAEVFLCCINVLALDAQSAAVLIWLLIKN